ncbi:hypothetical protein HMPREF9138_01928 [Prevotella histicola F0411]|uniref:Uncharacterized protein n=1 Tax=Prevotella histicola F0411 TaxID=857291 RepID=G6AIK1_9BACT|nr:hypothetical protein HMPREF9138_01928 [Prevotella histicola F0411]
MIFNNILQRFRCPKGDPQTTSLHPFNHAFSFKKPTLTLRDGRED